jgi:hypothetical protein
VGSEREVEAGASAAPPPGTAERGEGACIATADGSGVSSASEPGCEPSRVHDEDNASKPPASIATDASCSIEGAVADVEGGGEAGSSMFSCARGAGAEGADGPNATVITDRAPRLSARRASRRR